MKNQFSIRGMKHVFKDNTNLRVGEEAALELGDQLTDFGEEIAEEAVEYAEEAGRKTVRAEDIKKALRNRTSLEVKEVRA